MSNNWDSIEEVVEFKTFQLDKKIRRDCTNLCLRYFTKEHEYYNRVVRKRIGDSKATFMRSNGISVVMRRCTAIFGPTVAVFDSNYTKLDTNKTLEELGIAEGAILQCQKAE